MMSLGFLQTRGLRWPASPPPRSHFRHTCTQNLIPAPWHFYPPPPPVVIVPWRKAKRVHLWSLIKTEALPFEEMFSGFSPENWLAEFRQSPAATTFNEAFTITVDAIRRGTRAVGERGTQRARTRKALRQIEPGACSFLSRRHCPSATVLPCAFFSSESSCSLSHTHLSIHFQIMALQFHLCHPFPHYPSHHIPSVSQTAARFRNPSAFVHWRKSVKYWTRNCRPYLSRASDLFFSYYTTSIVSIALRHLQWSTDC